MSHPYRDRPIAATHVWLTPPKIINALGQFDLDPCAAPDPRPWDTAKRHITLPSDGLVAEWSGRVWLNPPYGSHTGKWLARLRAHGNGIALVFARTDTRMFHGDVWAHADGLLFIEGRPHFHRPNGERARGNSGGPLVLVAYGRQNADALDRSGIPGFFLRMGS